jgi:hypothetical protein
MGTDFVVTAQPIIGDFPDLPDGFKDVGVKHFIAIGPIKTLNEGVLIGFSGWMKRSVMLLSLHHCVKT